MIYNISIAMGRGDRRECTIVYVYGTRFGRCIFITIFIPQTLCDAIL